MINLRDFAINHQPNKDMAKEKLGCEKVVEIWLGTVRAHFRMYRSFKHKGKKTWKTLKMSLPGFISLMVIESKRPGSTKVMLRKPDPLSSCADGIRATAFKYYDEKEKTKKKSLFRRKRNAEERAAL